MELHTLDFAKIVLLRKDIAEVVINNGVVMTRPIVDRYHDFLLNHLQAPFSLLVNKINDYNYDFQGQLSIGNIAQIHAMAIVCYNRKSEITTHLLTHTTPRKIEWNYRVFPQRDMALEWLEEEQLQVLSNNPDQAEVFS